jgi:hypothetical protein
MLVLLYLTTVGLKLFFRLKATKDPSASFFSGFCPCDLDTTIIRSCRRYVIAKELTKNCYLSEYRTIPIQDMNMKLIYIKSTMEPKNYSTIRSILKRERGEKIAPYVFKISDTKAIKEYLNKERITYEVYQEEGTIKRALENSNQESRKKRKVSEE